MKLAMVFPGQGSQSVGMLDAFAADAAVGETVALAAAALDEDLGRLMSEGPPEALGLTTNTQPVMLTAGVAVWRAWCARGGAQPAFMAGHSLGEYAALCASGAIDLEAAVRLVRFRAVAMQEAVPVGVGAMAAILGMNGPDVIALCAALRQDDVLEAVNFNEPSQTVIAGHRMAVERACERARAEGAKRALVLPVSAPFHSSLMAPAGRRLADYLEGVDIRGGAIDVVNNVDVTVEHDPARIRDALVRQASGAVRWVETIQFLKRSGVTHLVECGPGKVLAGLARRIDRDLQVLALTDPKSLDEALEACS